MQAPRQPRVPPLEQRAGAGARCHLAQPRVAQTDGLEYLVVGKGEGLEKGRAAPACIYVYVSVYMCIYVYVYI